MRKTVLGVTHTLLCEILKQCSQAPFTALIRRFSVCVEAKAAVAPVDCIVRKVHEHDPQVAGLGRLVRNCTETNEPLSEDKDPQRVTRQHKGIYAQVKFQSVHQIGRS